MATESTGPARYGAASSTGTGMPHGGVIASVEPGSPADRAGLRPGETVLAADGSAIVDVIDWQWYSAENEVSLSVVSEGVTREVFVTRKADEAWGLAFAEALFDGVHTCRNNCAFCFMTQLPKGMRPSLYLRDDDYRLSFLSGNFITLTNLADADVERIGEQQLSPLYVSLHAVDPQVRGKLVCAREDRALQRFDELLDSGIELHVQIVLVPDVNDGDVLDETLTWLAEREGVTSVGIVPLGFTRYQERFSASYSEQITAARVIEQVQRWQFAFRERDGVTWVHLADEFYLNARAPFPRTEWYDGFPQYENGIGLVRSFVDEVTEVREELASRIADLPAEEERVTVITGILAATTLAGALEACDAVGRVRLLAVGNRFFGGNVSVTGLLTGQDIVDAILAHPHEGIYLLPDVVLNVDGVTLDDMTLAGLREASGADIRLVSCDAGGLLEGLTQAASEL